MKKRNTAIRALSVFLAYSMVCTSVPAAGQEMFGSEVNRETEENTSDLKEFQSSQADEFGTDTGSDAELFGSDDAKQEFQDGENSEEGTDGIRYIKGRPLTEEERKDAGIEILPDNLYDAIKYLNEDKFICGVLGEHITTKYTEAKLKEWDDYKTQVTQWELDEYLYKF